MTNFVQVLQACESANGAGSKKTIKAALETLDAPGKVLMELALNSYTPFGIKQYNMPGSYSEVTDTQPLITALHACIAREVTGDAARAAVELALSFCTEEDAVYLSRIIDKDLRAGFSIDTYNKVHPENAVPSFDVMLADTCKTEEEFEQYVTFPCIADVKYDGQRTIAFVTGGPVRYRARTGKESTHLMGLFDDELNGIRAQLGYDFIVDCEAFASDFTETINAKKAGNDTAKANLTLHVFNIMPLTHWMAGYSPITMEENRQNVIRIFTSDRITPSKSIIVNDYQEMMDLCDHVIDVEKQEGLILKKMSALYEWKRSMTWCKVKRFFPADARIIGFYYGKPKGKHALTVGGAIVAGHTEEGVYFETCVGSGFLDFPDAKRPLMPTRSEILAELRKYIGQTAVLKYQELSKSSKKTHAALRFPTIVMIRDDKLIEIPDDAVLHFPDRTLIPVA